eukprot:15352415-Ditylum_brightwellii.AAC.1
MGLLLVATICMAQSAGSEPKLRVKLQTLCVDSEFFIIEIDIQASICISNNPDHSVMELKPWPSSKKKQTVLDFGRGTTEIERQAMLRWRIEDNNGKVSIIDIPNLVHVPSAPYCILSPQHWVKQVHNNYPNKYGTWCGTFEDSCILQWKQHTHMRMVKHNPRTNIPKLQLALGTIYYHVTLAVLEANYGTDDLEHLCYDTHLVHDSDAKSDEEQDLEELEDAWQYVQPPSL